MMSDSSGLAGEEQGILASINTLLHRVGIDAKPIHSFEELRRSASSMFVAIFEAMFQKRQPGIVRRPTRVSDYVHNAEVVIGALPWNLEQNHITGEAIVRGEMVAIRNLVDIFTWISEVRQEGRDSTDGTAGHVDHDVSADTSGEFGAGGDHEGGGADEGEAGGSHDYAAGRPVSASARAASSTSVKLRRQRAADRPRSWPPPAATASAARRSCRNPTARHGNYATAAPAGVGVSVSTDSEGGGNAGSSGGGGAIVGRTQRGKGSFSSSELDAAEQLQRQSEELEEEPSLEMDEEAAREFDNNDDELLAAAGALASPPPTHRVAAAARTPPGGSSGDTGEEEEERELAPRAVEAEDERELRHRLYLRRLLKDRLGELRRKEQADSRQQYLRHQGTVHRGRVHMMKRKRLREDLRLKKLSLQLRYQDQSQGRLTELYEKIVRLLHRQKREDDREDAARLRALHQGWRARTEELDRFFQDRVSMVRDQERKSREERAIALRAEERALADLFRHAEKAYEDRLMAEIERLALEEDARLRQSFEAHAAHAELLGIEDWGGHATERLAPAVRNDSAFVKSLRRARGKADTARQRQKAAKERRELAVAYGRP